MGLRRYRFSFAGSRTRNCQGWSSLSGSSATMGASPEIKRPSFERDWLQAPRWEGSDISASYAVDLDRQKDWQRSWSIASPASRQRAAKALAVKESNVLNHALLLPIGHLRFDRAPFESARWPACASGFPRFPHEATDVSCHGALWRGLKLFPGLPGIQPSHETQYEKVPLGQGCSGHEVFIALTASKQAALSKAWSSARKQLQTNVTGQNHGDQNVPTDATSNGHPHSS